jgi:bifunctional non-homologous end joining protein LigD
VEVSSPDKVIYPADAITKAEVVAHYERVGPRMLDFIAGRPLTLQRFPRGIGSRGFMQKNAAEHFPDSIRRLPVPKRDGGVTVYPVVDNVDDIAYLANQNTLTFHMWLSSAERPGEPDWMVIDLDPPEGDVEAARSATRTIRSVLQSFDVDGFALATGSKGFHMWVPLEPGIDFAATATASRAVAGLAALRDPDALTLEFLKKNRRGRVFIDWLRNAPTATVVAPYSLRPRPGAPVAVPLSWDEFDRTDPDGCRIADPIEDRSAPDEVLPVTLPVDRMVDVARQAGIDLDTPHDRFGRDLT